jgi:hypothetical protein
MSLNIIERENLLRVISRLTDRVNRLESILNGIPIDTVRIADAAITDAKIDSLSADKITAGIISVLTQLGGDTGDNARIELDGENTRIVLYEDDDGTANPQIVITI